MTVSKEEFDVIVAQAARSLKGNSQRPRDNLGYSHPALAAVPAIASLMATGARKMRSNRSRFTSIPGSFLLPKWQRYARRLWPVHQSCGQSDKPNAR